MKLRENFRTAIRSGNFFKRSPHGMATESHACSRWHAREHNEFHKLPQIKDPLSRHPCSQVDAT